MTSLSRSFALSMAAAATVVLLTPSPAAASSCVAQSIRAEHQAYGPAWGHDVIGFLASHREVLAGFGFDSFGALASYSAHQDPANCPPDL